MTNSLHRKFNEKTSLGYIKNRYKGMRKPLDAQVKSLQKDEGFLLQCDILYANGYKDWHILSAIYNLMFAAESGRLGIDPRNSEGRRAQMALGKDFLEGVVLPSCLFSGPEWDRCFQMHAFTCLQTYGFEIRNPRLDTAAILRFMRVRLRHFDLDIPHLPIFGRPPAVWPEV